MASWRLAKSLETLRKQINAEYPKRKKTSDGTIGDARHRAKKSDHNPNSKGVVCAWDITEDPVNGPNLTVLNLYLMKDPRLHYTIYERKIYNPSIQSGKARPAKGHEAHMHVSVRQVAKLYDDPSPWKIKAEAMPSKTTSAPKPAPATPTPTKTALYDPMRAVNFFEKRGWSRFAAAALVASLMWESGGNKLGTILWDAQGDKDKQTGEYKSRYSGQWQLSRLRAYEAFAKANKRAATDPYMQLAFVDHELNSSEKKAAKALRAATTIEEANDAAILYWRPSVPHAAKRLAIAKKYVQL